MFLQTLIVIPARYGSTRLPAKPLAMIAGKTMIERVVAIARNAKEIIEDNELAGVDIVVATDHEEIMQECAKIAVPAVMTSPDCPTGTDRVFEAYEKMIAENGKRYVFLINLQGDAPLTPPHFIVQMVERFLQHEEDADIITPVTRLSWDTLDALREQKKVTPFSGTTVTFNAENRALWFSKQIIPAIRDEQDARDQSDMSPVHRHIGLYGYKTESLARYNDLNKTHYETLEGLEQLRALENDMAIYCVPVSYGAHIGMSGVDSPEDIKRAEDIIAKQGDIL